MNDSHLNLNSRHRKVAKFFAAIFFVAIIFFIFFYSYRYFSLNKEREVSYQVNDVLREIIDQKIFPPSSEKNKKKENLDYSNLSKKLYQIYKMNSSTINGKRALWYSSYFDFKSKKFKDSLKKVLLIIKNDEFYLTPNAFYLQVLIYENLEQFDKAQKIIDKFIKNYTDHYLNFNIRIARARIYLMMRNRDEAYKEYLELKKNSEYISYTDIIEEKIQQFHLIDLVKKK